MCRLAGAYYYGWNFKAPKYRAKKNHTQVAIDAGYLHT